MNDSGDGYVCGSCSMDLYKRMYLYSEHVLPILREITWGKERRKE